MMKDRPLEIMIHGVRNRVAMSLRAIWRTSRDVELGTDSSFEFVTCIVEEDILQGDLLQMNAVNLDAPVCKRLDDLR